MKGYMPTLWTWKADDAEFVILTKHEDKTLVYMCSTDMVYFAKSGYEFEGSDALIGQFVVDNVNGGSKIGRLLVFDINIPGSAQERYKRLQSLNHGPNINMQWCGDQNALSRDFLKSLPHPSSSLLGLTNMCYVYNT